MLILQFCQKLNNFAILYFLQISAHTEPYNARGEVVGQEMVAIGFDIVTCTL